jgi:hypothetical protein
MFSLVFFFFFSKNFSDVDVALETLGQGLVLGEQQCQGLIQGKKKNYFVAFIFFFSSRF